MKTMRLLNALSKLNEEERELLRKHIEDEADRIQMQKELHAIAEKERKRQTKNVFFENAQHAIAMTFVAFLVYWGIALGGTFIFLALT